MTQLRSVMAVATVPSFAPPPRANGRSSTRLHSGGARRLIEATSSRPLVPWPQAPLHGLVSFLPGRPRKGQLGLPGVGSASRLSVRRVFCTAASERKQELLSLDSVAFSENHRFYSYANWLVPGKVMLGRYPFIEPNRCRSRVQGEDQLRSILQTGVTVFCSLQDELPEQVKMPVGGIDGFVPYKATVDLMASAMSGPVPQEQQVGLRNPWLDSYLPPRKRKQAPVQENKVEPKYVRFPIIDMDITSVEMANQVVDFLCDEIDGGKKVYLHCWGGRGRAGMLGACYLMKAYGLNAEEALQRVQLAYNTRNDPPAVSPETDAQVQFVREYEQYCQSS
mmetsp:Transcript_30491/g.54642  ORF Transcript_30491/g.54642 Transcript_30491/m.54642 type:complete len:336 (-) Transcript_30491:196-1203(-)|eukprot:CAMPEP_0177777186 /NCGR_PEP_ID=MMETSP0491_2-20121128/15180_1 /TAXON_ID=63592 /ORGANISM="Tetraselmis chuii, Strain PLY429" /LENGTH=335 /DNA_ID=CAMNT_0019296163 /DNA_START=180 /DNA_END=1187 /DNA_ORIENTATION=-